MAEPHQATQPKQNLDGTMSNDSALPKSMHIVQAPVEQIDDFVSSASDEETSDFDDAASDEYWPDDDISDAYWPDDEDLSTAEEEEQESTENILMAEMLASEQAFITVSLLVEKT
jgi:hypothetical protein